MTEKSTKQAEAEQQSSSIEVVGDDFGAVVTIDGSSFTLDASAVAALKQQVDQVVVGLSL